MKTRAAAWGILALGIAQLAQAQTCTPGETRCNGGMQQRCDVSSGYNASTARWRNLNQSYETGNSSGGYQVNAGSGPSRGSYSDIICNTGDTRCDAGGHIQSCGGTYWATDYNALCKSAPQTLQKQELCSVGDQKCGPSNTILECKQGFGNADPKWQDTYRRCR